jgi:hypothetical protein
VALVSSQNPSTFGQSVTFTSTVTGQNGGSPSGTVTFKDGATVLGSAPVSNGSAQFSTSTLNKGQHHIYAAYSGDVNFKAATGALAQSVQ